MEDPDDPSKEVLVKEVSPQLVLRTLSNFRELLKTVIEMQVDDMKFVQLYIETTGLKLLGQSDR